MATPTVSRYQGPAEIWLNSRALFECKSIRWSVTGNNNEVLTMRKGLAGKADGPRKSEATIDSAVPIAGLEANLVSHVITGKPCSLVFKVGKTRVQITGWFEEANGEASTDAASNISGTFKGGPPQLSGG